MNKIEHIFWILVAALIAVLSIFSAGLAYISNETFFCFGGWCAASLTSMLYLLRLSSIKRENKL